MRIVKFPVILGVLLSCFCPSSFAQDWPNLKRYRKANAQLSSSSSDKGRVVFIGNSITDHWDNRNPSFFKDAAYVNRGISGQTTPQMLIRFRADVIQLHPKVVTILAGTNDIAGNTGPSTLRMIENNLASMCQLANANGIKIILCSVLPAYQYPWNKEVKPARKIKRLNKWINEYAQKKGYIYLNYYDALANKRGGMKQKYTVDGVHPNKAGYKKIMDPLVVKAIKKTLK